MKFLDSLTNVLTRLGTTSDKTTYVRYAFTPLDAVQLENAYRGDWIAAKTVDIPAQDATREWRAWIADKDQIEKIESVEKKFKVLDKVLEALTKARLYGGAGIIIGINSNEKLEERIEVKNIFENDLKFLHVIDAKFLREGPLCRDIYSEYFNTPEYYEHNGIRVDPSRVVRFVGRQVPSSDTTAQYWGDSILQAVHEALRNAGLAQAEIAHLIQESNVDVIKIPDFMNSVGTQNYENKIFSRWALAVNAKSSMRGLIIDAEEDWQKMSPNFSGLPDILTRYLNIAAAAADVPATRLLGQAPGGLNSAGDSDIRNYYDNLRARQVNVIGPALQVLDEIIIRSALGERPPEIRYEWRPLWQISDVEKAQIAVSKSQAVTNYVNTGLLTDSNISEALVNMLTEDGLLPGLEINSVDLSTDENNAEVKKQFETLKNV